MPASSHSYLFSLYSVLKSSRYEEQLVALFQQEWSDFTHESLNMANTPEAIVVERNNEVVAGIAFTRYPAPDDPNVQALWLNAVYVKSKYRGLGLARRLVLAAIQEAYKISEPALYAYTNVGGMYERLSWEKVAKEEENEVGHSVYRYKLDAMPSSVP